MFHYLPITVHGLAVGHEFIFLTDSRHTAHEFKNDLLKNIREC
ncbi:hypothetical protein KsCSTR_37100 [Candidatus Kuenenia stuttgartiensis]|uniref:Uncharacterized protein n=1 Tax=Kuenenia stuttgartiensis TaxID=174633 RepID=A0A6G7GUZ0_KUEST|nr:hypothetical protein KsCSTR_37100 [Candidatus Kuenenia stuttgartiensis]